MRRYSNEEKAEIIREIEGVGNIRAVCRKRGLSRTMVHNWLKKEFPKFETERLFLRGLRLSDSASYQKHYAHWAVVRLLRSTVPWPYPPNGAKIFIQSCVLPHQGIDRWVWGIFLKENSKELIGCVDLRRKGNPDNRGYWLAQQHWGKGLMTEAVQPILDCAFEKLGFQKMIFANAVQNKASRRIKEKTGCRFIGVRPQKFLDPKLKESEIWELSRDDWLKFRRQKAGC